ncbi:unnamed protein product [Rhizophagus irregularis]|nr:unnamed protein product [Rhizophagus irregularis]
MLKKYDDTIIEENIKLQAGDVVEIEGKEDNDDIENEKWFARIQAIFVHRSNYNNYHVFLSFEWFDLIGFDQIMQCNRYLLQGRNEN